MEEVLCIPLLNKNLFFKGLATKKELAITYYKKNKCLCTTQRSQGGGNPDWSEVRKAL
jgi:hypothetical protein